MAKVKIKIEQKSRQAFLFRPAIEKRRTHIIFQNRRQRLRLWRRSIVIDMLVF